MKKKYTFNIIKLKDEKYLACVLLFILNATRKIHLARKSFEKRNPRPTLSPPKYESAKEWEFITNN